MPEPFPGVYPGTISTTPDVAALVKAADLVALGTVGAVRDEGEVVYRVGTTDVGFRRRVAALQVERALKGAAGAGGLVEVEFLQPEVPSSMTRLHEGEAVVLFLKRRGPRHALVDLVTSAIEPRRLRETFGHGAASPRSDLVQALQEAMRDPAPDVSVVANAILEQLG